MPAYSPPSGCSTDVSSGRSAANMGRATNSVTRPPPLASSVPLTRSGRRVVALHQMDAVNREQRPQQFGHERRIGIDEIGVDECDQIAGRCGDRTATATSPLPAVGGMDGTALSRLITVAPRPREHRSAVRSVEPESRTINSSTKPPSNG